MKCSLSGSDEHVPDPLTTIGNSRLADARFRVMDAAVTMHYREAIDWLFSTQMFGIKLGLDGPRHLLKEFLAYPAHGTQVIHVAGTNGKGSTCAMIDSIARACGRRTGLFTSPHLIDFRERIKVSGQEIPEEDCAAMLTELRAICERMETHPTFFEITLVLAMRWFRERECELIILETGMGGRLDATTAVPADVCVVTPIGLDHMQWLGDTLEAIAAEKAGIFVTGKPAISAPQEPPPRFVLEKEANETRAPIEFVERAVVRLSDRAGRRASEMECRARRRRPPPRRPAAQFRQRPPRTLQRLVAGTLRGNPARRHPRRRAQSARRQRCSPRPGRSEFPGKKAALVFSVLWRPRTFAGILAILAPLASKIFLCPVDTPRARPGRRTRRRPAPGRATP